MVLGCSPRDDLPEISWLVPSNQSLQPCSPLQPRSRGRSPCTRETLTERRPRAAATADEEHAEEAAQTALSAAADTDPRRPRKRSWTCCARCAPGPTRAARR